MRNKPCRTTSPLKQLIVYTTAPLLFCPASHAEPLSAELVYTGELWSNLQGGTAQDNVYLDNLDVTLTLDAEAAWGWDGVTAFAYGIYNNNDTLADKLVSSVHGISNIDTTSMFGVLELWIDKTWSSNHSIRFGLYDLNSEFDALDTAGFFLNPSHGIGPDFAQSGENGPSIFPYTSLALRLQGELTQATNYRIAILDAVPGNPDDDNHSGITWSSDEGFLLAAELDRQFAQSRAGLGAWYYTKNTEQLANPVQPDQAMRNNKGLYGFIDHTFTEKEWLPGQLNGFVRLGFADSHINQLGSYVGAGVVLSRFLDSRADDTIGFALASGVNGADFKRLNRQSGIETAAHETNIELSYSAPVGNLVTVQADIQYVLNPATEQATDNALLVGLRFEFELN